MRSIPLLHAGSVSPDMSNLLLRNGHIEITSENSFWILLRLQAMLGEIFVALCLLRVPR